MRVYMLAIMIKNEKSRYCFRFEKNGRQSRFKKPLIKGVRDSGFRERGMYASCRDGAFRGRGDHLLEFRRTVGDIACRENTGDGRRHVDTDPYESAFVRRDPEIACEISIRIGTDLDKESICRKRVRALVRSVEPYGRKRFLADERNDVRFENDVHLRIIAKRFQKVFLGTHRFSPVDEPHFCNDAGKIHGGTGGAVVASDDGHSPVAIEEPVTRGAVRYAPAEKLGFTVDTEHPMFRPCGEQYHPAPHHGPAVLHDDEGVALFGNLHHHPLFDECAVFSRMRHKRLGKFKTASRIDAGIIVDLVRLGNLPARKLPDHDMIDPVPGSVYGCRQTGRPRTNNDERIEFVFVHGRVSFIISHIDHGVS